MDSQVIANFKELQSLIEKIGKENTSLNGLKPIFNLGTKLVYEDGDLIYRIEEPYHMKRRIAFSKYCNEVLGFDFFEEEKIIEENDCFCISVQIKLRPFEDAPGIGRTYETLNYYESPTLASKNNIWDFRFCNRVMSDYGKDNYERIYDIFHSFQIRFIHEGNVGINSKGKIQCFDYAMNVGFTPDGKLDVTQNSKDDC